MFFGLRALKAEGGERREKGEGEDGEVSVASHTKTIADMLKYQSTFCYSSAGAQLEAGVALALGLPGA